jgi:hypothetical protein
MTPLIKKQIKLFEEYGITNYVIENDKIVINGNLNLESLTEVHKDLFRGLTINGWLNLYSLKDAHKDLFKGLTINGDLNLNSLKDAHKDLFKGLTINGSLYLQSLKEAHEDLFKGLTTNSWIYFNPLTIKQRKFLMKNVTPLKIGYNKERCYCYFDGILSKVLSVTTKLGYTIYTTPFEYIVQKGKYTAHAKTPKKGIEDLNFKIFVKNLKNKYIQKDTLMTVKLYRTITGACDNGVQNWLRTNNIPFKVIDNETIEENPITAEELLPLLEETKAYGLEKIKTLINW